jgi:hypothetical protein
MDILTCSESVLNLLGTICLNLWPSQKWTKFLSLFLHVPPPKPQKKHNSLRPAPTSCWLSMPLCLFQHAIWARHFTACLIPTNHNIISHLLPLSPWWWSLWLTETSYPWIIIFNMVTITMSCHNHDMTALILRNKTLCEVLIGKCYYFTAPACTWSLPWNRSSSKLYGNWVDTYFLEIPIWYNPPSC